MKPCKYKGNVHTHQKKCENYFKHSNAARCRYLRLDIKLNDHYACDWAGQENEKEKENGN